MTELEREEQRRSFAYGNTSIGNPRITRETVDQAAADLERVIETTRQYRDELFSRTPHPEERGVKLGISDQVAEEVLLHWELDVSLK
jgi:hypothetical protein